MIWQYQHFQILAREDGTPWELGRGARGITYKARDTNLRADVALKVVRAEAIGGVSGRERFFNEVRATASIRHRNVASIYHLGEQGDEFFLAMELVSGCPLEVRLRERGKLPLRQALEIALQVAKALGASEKQGLVHRDIRPANLMLTRDDDGCTVVKVIGFGQAGGPGEAVECQGAPHYASPEQLRGLPPDVRSDMYSLGATLHHMLTGTIPCGGAPAQSLERRPRSELPGDALQAFPEGVRQLVLRLLAEDPCARPATTAALRALLAGCLDLPVGEASQTHPPAMPKPQAPRTRRFPTGYYAAAALGAGVLAAAIFFRSGMLAKPPADPPPPARMPAPADQPSARPTAPPAGLEGVAPAAPSADSLESLMAEAVALQAQEKHAESLLACARVADRFPDVRAPRDHMEMIAAFLRSNAFVMTPEKFADLRPALEAAAARNVVSAQILLGEKLRNLAPAEALKWFRAAAENGQTEAMTQAGLMLANGRGTSGPDMRLALGWFQRAADCGNTDAMAALAECLIFGKGTDKEPRRAAELLRAAAAFNHPRALNLLGDLHVKGSGVPQDFPEAFRLFSRASEIGDGDASANLGVLYMRGQGVAANPSKAVAIWKAGAEKGSPSCMLNLAKALESGSGTPANAAGARRWYLEAARAGNEAASDWCRRFQ